MKKTFAVAVALLALSPPCRADEKQAKATLERAVKAHGGAAALAKAARRLRTDVGTLSVQGKDVPLVRKVTLDLPDRRRLEIQLDKAVESTQILDGDRAYSNDRGVTTTLSKQRLDELREEAYVDWLCTLAPLQKDFTLSSLDKAEVAGEAAVGLEAAHKGRPNVRLYFSEKTGLLLKVSWRGTSAGKDVDKERTYSGHKDFDGVKLHTREATTLDGKKLSEVTISDVSFPAKLDAKTFARP